MNLKEIERVVAGIQTHLFRNSNSFSIGMLKSNFKGAGLQFKEHQVYTPGDDVRFIDWKLSAKSSNTYVKTFEEERNIEIIPFLDITNTMFMGYKGVSKLQAAIEIVCLLYLLAEKTKDKIKPIIYTGKSQILPPQAGKEGITFFISILEKKNILLDSGKVNLEYSLDVKDSKREGLLKSLVARGKEVVYLSDFSDFDNIELINKLLYRRNMHCFKVMSPIDNMKKMPYSIFTNINNKNITVRANTSGEKELKGRFKKLDVSQRYLETFIREML
ncbi:MAG: DUF58 domain-containing protein [Bacteriovoracaceae bacterium]|jgi:hypothetical protein|nr:DUF58 domain-containing protein [Bacteriovoracaceae bacterium]